ncbi:MAG: response regulator [Anaerolineae bacterium]|nr:response regulator [Anaerolineae bacterium]
MTTMTPEDNPIRNPIVLIVEDDQRNADLLRVMLRLAGIQQVILCRTGKDIAPAVLPYPSVDLVLLDLALPEEDGFQILRRLRQWSLFKDSTIVATTALVMPQDVARAEEAGFDGFLGKPFHFDRFTGQIRRLLAGERVWEPRW